MKLEHKFLSDYVCDLTRELDELSGVNAERDWIYHYVMVDEYATKNKEFPLRVPGGTIGGIWLDEENRIKKISIDTGYVVKTYPDNINELVQKYVGTVIEFE